MAVRMIEDAERAGLRKPGIRTLDDRSWSACSNA